MQEALSDCLEESERVLGILQTMMNVAEAEAGTMRLDRSHLAIAEIIEDVHSLYSYVAEDKQIELLVACDTGLVVDVDKMRMTQVVANLVDNAIKYSPSGSCVKLSGKSEDDTICISVEDEGMGISDSELPRIWERMYRGDRSRSQHGLGLGLNYVKAVVEMHGGTVSVSSRLRQGAAFTVRLAPVRENLLPAG